MGDKRQCEVTVNGVPVGNVPFTQTASWDIWDTVSIEVTLNSGDNIIRVTANTTAGGPNLDKMDVSLGN
ncbi:MAG: hypothetical protein ABFS17_04990 [Chloroflexota bacterium]